MGAVIGKIGMGLLGAGGLIPKPGADTAIVSVRIGRVVYIGSLTYIAGLWYFGWRNQRAEPGSFPIPGVFKGPVIRPDGAPDSDEPADIKLGVVGSDSTPGNTITQDPMQDPKNNLAPAGPPTGLQGNATLLVQLGNIAPHFGVRATEHPKFGGVAPGAHNPKGYHPRGRAIDFVGPPAAMATFAKYLDENYRNRIAELIWAGPQPKSVKNGASVPSTFWGAATWANHRDHIHLAI